jgi:hypothetical protein
LILFSSESVSFKSPIRTDEISSFSFASNVRPYSLFRLQLNSSFHLEFGVLTAVTVNIAISWLVGVSVNISPSSSAGRVSQGEATQFAACFFLGLPFNPEDGGHKFL